MLECHLISPSKTFSSNLGLVSDRIYEASFDLFHCHASLWGRRETQLIVISHQNAEKLAKFYMSSLCVSALSVGLGVRGDAITIECA